MLPPSSRKLLSLADIAALERAFMLGTPTLGRALEALAARWDHGLRDEETFARFVFLNWLRHTEQDWVTGIDAAPHTPQEQLDAVGVDSLSPELCFVVAFLAHRAPHALGDAERWTAARDPLFRRAAAEEPRSVLFREWQWCTGSNTTLETPVAMLRAEVVARFLGRGLFGEWFRTRLTERLPWLQRFVP